MDLLALALFVCMARQGSGEVVELPLPELTGEFKGSGSSLSTNVHLENPPDSVQRVSMRVIGDVVPGLARCRDRDVAWSADLTAETYDGFSRGWIAGGLVPKPAEIGVLTPFEITFEFHSVLGGTWETLMSGEFTIAFYAAPAGLLGICSGVTTPRGSVTEVWLIIEGIFPTPVAPSTWGRMKALWR